MLLEKMQAFAEERKINVASVPGSQIAEDYEAKRTDAWSQIEDLGITSRIVSTRARRRTGPRPQRAR
jgi:amphiphysin